MLQVLGLVGRAQHVGVSGVGLLGAHLVAEAVLGHEGGHLGAATELVDESAGRARACRCEGRIGQQTVAVKALDVVALEGGAVAPDVDVVLLHGGDQHGAGDSAAERRGVEVGRRPAVVMWKAPACSAAMPSRTSWRRQSIRRAFSAPYSRPCAESRRSRFRRAGPDWRCRRRARRPSASSSAAQRWCRARRRRRCRLCRRWAGFAEWWLIKLPIGRTVLNWADGLDRAVSNVVA